MTRRSLLALFGFLCLAATALVPATAGAAVDQDERTVKKISYGYGIEIARLSGDQRKLTGTPAHFKRFVKGRLDAMFEDAGSRPRCATAPLVVVDRYHGDGWAHAGEGSYGRCPSGGHNVIYQRGRSGWHQILGAQDTRFCEDLAWWGVPRFIAGTTCLTEELASVRYKTHDVTRVSPEAAARRAISHISGPPIMPAKDVMLPAVLTQLKALDQQGAWLTVGGCIAADDDSSLVVHLGDAAHGCAVTATDTLGKDGKTESIMLRMDAEFLVTELYPFA